jgi:hypothetical protein
VQRCRWPQAATTPAATTPAATTDSGNRAPTISGSPPPASLYGRQYSFRPSATDPDGDALTFTISSVPTWARFDAATGRLEGTPGPGDVGMTQNLTIGVSDGQVTTNLPAFSVNVVATASGSATLSWAAPTSNSDGTPLTNLAAYRIYFGMSSDALTNAVTISNPGIATYVVDQLTPATWYFVVTAVNSGGSESGLSNVGTKRVL